jgi:murein L,D-transpeptidase YcbB/YkuD
MDLMNLLPIALRFTPLLPKAQALFSDAGPALSELKKVLPQVVAHAREIIRLLYPTITIAMRDWPAIEPRARELYLDAAPEIKALLGELPEPMPVAEDVLWIQESLNKLGYSVALDNVYSFETRDAVMRFQKEHDLHPDGWAGIATLAALYVEAGKK